MTEKEKKVVFTLIGIMVVILIIAVCINIFTKGKENTDKTQNNGVTSENVQNKEKYITTLNDGTKLNNSEDLKKAKKYKDIEITGIQITKNNIGNTVILANVKNTASTDFERETVKLTLIGENGETIVELKAIMPNIKAGETEQFDHTITADFANIKNFNLEAM